MSGGKSQTLTPIKPTPSEKKLIIYKHNMSNQDDKKLIINDVNKKLEGNPDLSFVFKEGFLEKLKTYSVAKNDNTNLPTTKTVSAGQLIYKEIYGLDDTSKYIDENGKEKEVSSLTSAEQNLLVTRVDITNTPHENNKEYYELRRQYLNSPKFISLEKFSENEKFNDIEAFNIEKTLYLLHKNIYYTNNKFDIISFFYEPDKASLSDINNNIRKEIIERKLEEDKKQKSTQNKKDIAQGSAFAAGGVTLSVAQIAAIAGGVASAALPLGLAAGGASLILGAGAYAGYKSYKKYKEMKDTFNMANRFKKQLHRVVHIITFAMELKKKYKTQTHLIDEWKDTMIHINLLRIYNKVDADGSSVEGALESALEDTLSDERMIKQQKIKDEYSKSWSPFLSTGRKNIREYKKIKSAKKKEKKEAKKKKKEEKKAEKKESEKYR